jgi:hypothetical protein
MTSALQVLWHVEGWLLFCTPLFTILFAINRGSLLRRINYHVITATIVTASLLVFGFLTDSLDDIVNFELVEGDQELLVRMGVSSIFLLSGAVALTYQIGEDTLDALYHAFMVASAQIAWFLAAKSTDHVPFWSYQAISTSILLFAHLITESKNSQCMNPSYGNSLLLTYTLYTFFFFLFTSLGPWFLEEISLVAQQSVLVVVDVLFICYFLFGVLHYGGEALVSNNTGLRPGCTEGKSSSELKQLVVTLHTH